VVVGMADGFVFLSVCLAIEFSYLYWPPPHRKMGSKEDVSRVTPMHVRNHAQRRYELRKLALTLSRNVSCFQTIAP